MHHGHMKTRHIGELVRSLRVKKGWLQTDMARETGWNQAKVSRIETGKAKPDLDDLEMLARVFAQPIAKLARIRMRAA